MNKSELVFQKEENFMRLHEEGLGIYEIAKKSNLSYQTVYNHLQSIAETHGVSRVSLLDQPHKPYETKTARVSKQISKIDIQSIKDSFAETDSSIEKLIHDIHEFLKKIETEEE